MKYVKGVAVFLVLCLVAYGAFTLLKKSPQVNVPEGDISYLEGLGIHVQGGQAADSGLSGILSDVEGLPSVGSSMGSSFGGGSSAPPSFLGNSSTSSHGTPSSVPPAFMNAAPRVATATIEPQTASGFAPSGVGVFPAPNFTESVDFPIQAVPVEVIPFDASTFDAPHTETLVPLEAPPITRMETPPPWAESWDGPSSDFSAVPPPSEFLQTLNSSSPIHNSPASTFPPIYEPIAYKPIEESIRRIESNPNSAPVFSPEMPDNQEHVFSTPHSIPLDAAAMPGTRYTRTSSRQPLTFELVQPEVSPTAPLVAFASPKRLQQPSQPQPPQPQQPVSQTPVAAVAPAAVSPVVNRIGAPRLIESAALPVTNPVTNPAIQMPIPTTIREPIERFVQSQRQLVESNDPDNIRLAFIQLSQLYELDQLKDAERTMIQSVLDVLALRVIYAKESHILEPPYRVKPGETIESIARHFNLTPALLRTINGLAVSYEVPAGTTLKVVHGQFDAKISLQRRELTLLLGGLYAGRFSFSLPKEKVSVRKEEFFITNRTDRTLVLNNGWVLATGSTRDATLVFSDNDARKIFDILSEQSVIVLE